MPKLHNFILSGRLRHLSDTECLLSLLHAPTNTYVISLGLSAAMRPEISVAEKRTHIAWRHSYAR